MAPENDAVIDIRCGKSQGRTDDRRTGMPASKMPAPKMKHIELDTSVVDEDKRSRRKSLMSNTCKLTITSRPKKS